MTRFFGLVTVRRRGAAEAEESEPEVKSTDRSRPLGLSGPEETVAPPSLSVLPEITRLAAAELKRKTEAAAAYEEEAAAVPEPAKPPAPKVALPETRWQRAGRLRAMGMREERIAADLGVMTSDLRLRWKLESLRGAAAAGVK